MVKIILLAVAGGLLIYQIACFALGDNEKALLLTLPTVAIAQIARFL